MRFTKLLVTMAPTALALLAAYPASSIAAVAAEPAPSSAGVIEEIVVTSRREAEAIQDVPVAVSAFTSTDLQRIAPRTLRDLDGLSPNVFIGMNTAGPSAGAIFIRGIGYADIEKTQSPQVGVIIDGLYQGTNTGQLVDMFDVDQLEINRGPQGVLYGKNTSGGTIVVTRTKPEFNVWDYAIGAQGGNYQEQQTKGRINVPLIDDKLALKLGALTKRRDGYYDNETRGGDAGKIDYQTYTAALRFQPIESLGGTFTYDHIRDRGDIPPQDPLWDGNNPFKNEADYNEFQQYDVNSYGLQMQWDVGFGVISSITGYQSAADKVGQDFDGSSSQTSQAVSLVQLHTLRDQNFKETTQELRLAGNITDAVSYTVGGFYYDTKQQHYQGTNADVQIANFLDALGVPCVALDGAIGGALAAGGLTDGEANPSVGDGLCQFETAESGQIVHEKVQSWAAFGAVNWNVTDTVELSLGLRYLDEQKDFQTAYYSAPVPTTSFEPPTKEMIVGGPLPGFPVASNDSWDKTIGRFTATWHVNDHSMVYASYAQGFRSGGFSLRGNDPRFLSYNPETADAFEIGTKNDFWDDRLRLNLTAFYTEVSDGQFTSIIPTNAKAPGTNTIINNGLSTNIYGFEVESTIVVTDTISIIGSLGLQKNDSDDVTISTEKYPFPLNNEPLPDGSANPFAGQSCNPTANPAYFPNAPSPAGNTCPTTTVAVGNLGRAPNYNYALSGVYSRDFGANNLTGSLTVHGQDQFVLGTNAGKDVEQGNYYLIDANLTYQWNFEHGTLRVSAIGKNLADEDYLEEYLSLGGNSGFQGWGAPRTYAMELLWQH